MGDAVVFTAMNAIFPNNIAVLKLFMSNLWLLFCGVYPILAYSSPFHGLDPISVYELRISLCTCKQHVYTVSYTI